MFQKERGEISPLFRYILSIPTNINKKVKIDERSLI